MSDNSGSIQAPRWGFIYTLTETHPGSEGTRGAIDLPIAREAATGLPFLPDTSLKGVARAATRVLEKGDTKRLERLFGRGLHAQTPQEGARETEGGATDEHEEAQPTEGEAPKPSDEQPLPPPGGVIFLQGSLLLYPLRSLQRLFVYATSPALLDRAQRMAQAFGMPPLFTDAALRSIRAACSGKDGSILVADSTLDQSSVFLERFANTVTHSKECSEVAERIAGFYPASQDEGGDPYAGLGDQIRQNLVVIPDGLLALLLETAPPVRARISINKFGTTESIQGVEGGNLWYEERLPADVLFWTIVKPRSVRVTSDDLDHFATAVATCQIGGGATVGHGQCLWQTVDEGRKLSHGRS